MWMHIELSDVHHWTNLTTACSQARILTDLVWIILQLTIELGTSKEIVGLLSTAQPLSIEFLFGEKAFCLACATRQSLCWTDVSQLHPSTLKLFHRRHGASLCKISCLHQYRSRGFYDTLALLRTLDFIFRACDWFSSSSLRCELAKLDEKRSYVDAFAGG